MCRSHHNDWRLTKLSQSVHMGFVISLDCPWAMLHWDIVDNGSIYFPFTCTYKLAQHRLYSTDYKARV